MVPGTAASPENLLEMLHILRSDPRPTESKTLGIGPAIIVHQALQVILMYTTVENHWVMEYSHFRNKKIEAQSLSNFPSTIQLESNQGYMTMKPLLLTTMLVKMDLILLGKPVSKT